MGGRGNGVGGDKPSSKVSKVAGAVSRAGNQKLLQRGRRAPIALIVGEEKSLVASVVKMRDGDRSTQRAAEGIEVLGRLAREPVRICIQCIVLKVLKQTAMKIIPAALGGERHIAYLRKLSAIIEGCYLHRSDTFLRWIGILQSAVLADVGRGDAVD